MQRALVVIAVAAVTSTAVTGAGCASSAPVHTRLALDAAMPSVEMPAMPPPRTPGEAQVLLSASIAALRAGEGGHAALFLGAILRSDHLTDRGRANVYWLLAEAQREGGNDPGLVDALGGFLVASEVVDADDDMSARQVEARGALLAARLKHDPLLGKSPELAIPVEDARDPAGVIAELRCGPRSDPYHERRVSSVGRLESRELVCAGDGSLLTLWFDTSNLR